MLGQRMKILVGCEHCQAVAKAKLRQDCVDRADLHTSAPTAIAKLGCLDVVAPVWGEQRQSTETLDNLLTRPRSDKTLQEFLQNKASRGDLLASLQRDYERIDFRGRSGHISPECQRPDARVNEKRHLRERSFL